MNVILRLDAEIFLVQELMELYAVQISIQIAMVHGASVHPLVNLQLREAGQKHRQSLDLEKTAPWQQTASTVTVNV